MVIKKKKEKTYELVTSKTGMDYPFVVFAKNKQSALRQVKPKLKKGERVISLKRGY